MFTFAENSVIIKISIYGLRERRSYQSLTGERILAILLEITDVRIRKVAKEGKMKAVVSITIDNEFVVHDIKVIEGEKGLFIAMPSRKAADGEYRDIAHPINSDTRNMIQTLILEQYEAMNLGDIDATAPEV